MNLTIFATGRGSNAESIIDYFSGNDQVKINLVISNKANAGVLDIAQNNDIQTSVVLRSEWEDQAKLEALLKETDYIILAGFLLKVPSYLIQMFPEKIINIHPALLPKFGGKGMYGMNVHQAVKDQGETESGITIHLVDEVYDNGRHLHQASVSLDGDETVQEIADKVLKLEHYHFPRVIESYISEDK